MDTIRYYLIGKFPIEAAISQKRDHVQPATIFNQNIFWFEPKNNNLKPLISEIINFQLTTVG